MVHYKKRVVNTLINKKLHRNTNTSVEGGVQRDIVMFENYFLMSLAKGVAPLNKDKLALALDQRQE